MPNANTTLQIQNKVLEATQFLQQFIGSRGDLAAINRWILEATRDITDEQITALVDNFKDSLLCGVDVPQSEVAEVAMTPVPDDAPGTIAPTY